MPARGHRRSSYADLLATPEQHAAFDPAQVHKRAIKAGLDGLAAKWRRKPRLKTANTKHRSVKPSLGGDRRLAHQ